MTYDLFEESIRSKETKKAYLNNVRRFQGETGLDLSHATGNEIQSKLIEVVIGMKKSGKSNSAQNLMVSAVQKWCEVFDIEGVKFKKVRGYMSEALANHNDVPYTMDQLESIMDAADLRTRAIILTMLSSGMRVGAIPTLRVGDLMPVENLYQVRVYSFSQKEAYTTFVTPEARRAIDSYIESRKSIGEIMTQDSPVFRLEFDSKSPNKKVEPMSRTAAMKAVEKYAIISGTRSKNKKENKHLRHTTPLTHSFRKLANSAFVKAGIKPIIVETLLGHSTGLQANYLRLTDLDLLAEYIKAVPLLTVSKESSLQSEVAELQTKVADIEMLKQIVARQARQIEERDRTIERIVDERLAAAGFGKGEKLKGSFGKLEPTGESDEDFKD